MNRQELKRDAEVEVLRIPCIKGSGIDRAILNEQTAFEVFINGQERFTAGGEDYQTLNALLGFVRLPLPEPDDTHISFFAHAMNPELDRVASWPNFELAVGDRIEIRVVDEPESVEALECGEEDGNA